MCIRDRNYIPDEATLCVLGAGGGILEATTLITALADKYKPVSYTHLDVYKRQV